MLAVASYAVLTLLALLSMASARAAEALPDVMSRMDKAAAAFKGMTAQMKRLDHTAVINDTSEERGAVALRKTSKGVQGLVTSTFPEPRTMAFAGSEFQFYLPKANTIQVYKVGGKRDQIDQFMVLGFGTSGKDLQKNYTVKLGGAETLNGVKTTRIELVPKDSKTLELFQRLDLWIPEGGNHAVQQKVFLKGGDYKLISYTDVKINPPLTDASFDLGAPRNAKKEYIGK
ncbi:hypothetical protein F183_A27750 [Bryobacterales bacterium F-183]|nr:hypothetical protein F183_A27750 [Bryobacterales bacterium F-183]